MSLFYYNTSKSFWAKSMQIPPSFNECLFYIICKGQIRLFVTPIKRDNLQNIIQKKIKFPFLAKWLLPTQVTTKATPFRKSYAIRQAFSKRGGCSANAISFRLKRCMATDIYKSSINWIIRFTVSLFLLKQHWQKHP